jgi:hypothetical protein
MRAFVFPLDPTGSSLRKNGFALVVTLSLMILLTVIAVGLLTLSSISLRTSSQGEAMATARADARVSLMLAIGDLQKQLGPDTRISATADQISSADPTVSTTPQAQKNWASAYNSWPAASATRPPAPEFRQWFVSGDPGKLTDRSFAATALGTGPTQSVEMVSARSVGSTGDPVRVPLVTQTVSGAKNNFAWWVSDEGVKAFVPSDPAPLPNGSSSQRLALQAPPNMGLKVMADAAGTTRPLENLDQEAATIRNLISYKQTELAIDPASRDNLKILFHDISSQNRGLLTNVRTGGFRKDLSMFLQARDTSVPRTPLYSVGGKNGINMAELWTYYNLPGQLKSNLSGSFTTGGAVPGGTPYLQPETSQNAFAADKFYFQKQPVFVRFQTVVSFSSRPVTNPSTGVITYSLGIVVDPIVTVWNPLDVPLSLSGSWNSIKYWPLPYDIVITSNGAEYRVPFGKIVANSSNPQYLTLRTGTDPLILKPGEVVVYSQGSNTPTTFTSGLKFINGKPGWGFGGGMFYDYKNNDTTVAGLPLIAPGNTQFSYRVEPNSAVNQGSQWWALNVHGIYYKEDRSITGGTRPDPAPQGSTETLQLGNYSIDMIDGQPFDAGQPKPTNLRILANSPKYKDFFDRIGSGANIRFNEISSSVGNKRPFMIFSYAVKTEVGAENPGRFLARYNPRATKVDFFDIEPNELRVLPFEVQTRPLNSWQDPIIDVSNNGSGYFGGGWTNVTGTKNVITHSIPRHPPVSLAAFQHSAANGFVSNSSGRLDNQKLLLPQIGHAIGNSMAPSVLAPDVTQGTIGGPRQLADHSYLANQALWDDWFLSSIAPQTTSAFTTQRLQKVVAQEFLASTSKPLPIAQYKPNLSGQDPAQLLGKLFNGNLIRPGSEALTASLISVEGMFNVNSTSVQAWKALLSALRDRNVQGQTLQGGDSTIVTTGLTPSAALLSPVNIKADNASLSDPKSIAQWSGVRMLKDEEIDELAKAIVTEVRKRGPFLSLADFINRRVGTDKSLAISGAIQSALDSDNVSINKPFRTGSRAATGNDPGLVFPEAEKGAAAYGIPGYVKQADILTPIAPLLAARSDTFIIRAYGEKTNAAGTTVIARAWCEAVVRRDANFVDNTDEPNKANSQLNPMNLKFGRRFELVSFRWLNPSEV